MLSNVAVGVEFLEYKQLTRSRLPDRVPPKETFPLQLLVHCLNNLQFVTLRSESGSYICFQVDTGAQYNVVLLNTYKKAMGGMNLSKVSSTQTQLTAYGGVTLPVVGSVFLRVWRGNFQCQLDCKLVDSPVICSLLGWKACLGMKIIAYLDNDELHKPDTGDAPVHALVEHGPVSTEELLSKCIAEVSTNFSPGPSCDLMLNDCFFVWGILISETHIALRDILLEI